MNHPSFTGALIVVAVTVALVHFVAETAFRI